MTISNCYFLIENQNQWDKDSLHDLILGYAKENGIKNGKMLWPIRTAMSGKPTSPGGAFDLMEILGKEESIRRIKVGIDNLK